MNETKGTWIRQHKFIFSDEHPPRLIAKTNDLNIGSKAQDANADLIISAVNACKLVSPDYPEHVAEAIKPMYEAGKNLDCAIGAAILEIARQHGLNDKLLATIQTHIIPAQERRTNMHYKLTDQKSKTHGDTQWGKGITHKAEVQGSDLCSASVIHCYDSPLKAALFNPIHANFEHPLLWEGKADRIVADDEAKIGCKKFTTLRQIPMPEITTEQRITFAIHCTKQVYKNEKWNTWADNWLSNKDRSAGAAEVAAAKAAAAGAGAAAAKAAAGAAAAKAAAEAAAAGAAAGAAAAGAGAAAAKAAAAEAAAWAAAWAAEAKTINIALKLTFGGGNSKGKE